MAGKGPAPKESLSRPRDQRAREESATVVTVDGGLRGPELPAMDDDSWHPRTLAWWETWRRSAQAQNFTATDWDFLVDTALMHHQYWSKGSWTLAAELRLRAAKFGATPEDRMRLKIEVTGDSAPKQARTRSTGAGSRKDRILNAVSDPA